MRDNYYTRAEMSRSKLCDLDKMSPYAFYCKHIAKTMKQNDTQALLFGRAFHSFVLEPDKFFTEFAVAPDVDKRTKVGKEAFAEFLNDVEGKDVLTSSDATEIAILNDALVEFGALDIINQCCLKEENFFFKLYDIDFKARLDCVDTKNHIIYDVKTMDKAYRYDVNTNQIDDKFFRDMSKYGNDAQTYIYSKAYEDRYGVMPRFVFICVEKKQPNEVQIIDVEESFINCGKMKVERLLEVYNTLVERFGMEKEWRADKYYSEAPMYAQEDLVLELEDGEEVSL